MSDFSTQMWLLEQRTAVSIICTAISIKNKKTRNKCWISTWKAFSVIQHFFKNTNTCLILVTFESMILDTKENQTKKKRNCNMYLLNNNKKHLSHFITLIICIFLSWDVFLSFPLIFLKIIFKVNISVFCFVSKMQLNSDEAQIWSCSQKQQMLWDHPTLNIWNITYFSEIKNQFRFHSFLNKTSKGAEIVLLTRYKKSSSRSKDVVPTQWESVLQKPVCC